MKNLLNQIDHVTYAADFKDEKKFIDRWATLGFRELVRLKTERFPAEHIALICEDAKNPLWTTMTGLSVSDDPASPINQFVRRYGEGIQHTAYAVNIQVNMDELFASLKEKGWNLMTPVLNYGGTGGALLKQFFVAPQKPYGSFVEFAQRLSDKNGNPFNGFDTTNIDDLYRHYDDYSKFLERA